MLLITKITLKLSPQTHHIGRDCTWLVAERMCLLDTADICYSQSYCKGGCGQGQATPITLEVCTHVCKFLSVSPWPPPPPPLPLPSLPSSPLLPSPPLFLIAYLQYCPSLQVLHLIWPTVELVKVPTVHTQHNERLCPAILSFYNSCPVSSYPSHSLFDSPPPPPHLPSPLLPSPSPLSLLLLSSSSSSSSSSSLTHQCHKSDRQWPQECPCSGHHDT